MRARSWMAALALIGVTSILIGRGLSAKGPGSAQKPDQAKNQEKPQPMPLTTEVQKPKPSDSNFTRVQLNLVVAGLGREGCDVEVKPANAGCRFRAPSPQHISSGGQAKVELKDVEIRGADHTCTVAITIREPGQTPKTVYRGFRLTNPRSGSPSATSSIPSFPCYLSSRMAEVDKERTRR